jgi:hypothetical protein
MDNYTVEKHFIVCFCIVLCVITISIATNFMYDSCLDHKLKMSAIEAGYEQKFENNVLVWTKSDFEKVEKE